MNIALDATPLILSTGGLPRYVSELAIALAEHHPDNRYTLYSDQEFMLPRNSPPNLRKGAGPRIAGERFWWARGLDRRLLAGTEQLFHGTNFEVPYFSSLPLVMTVHDLSPWKDGAWHRKAGRVRQRTPWLLRFKRSLEVITASAPVRDETIERFNLSADRVHAIPLAASGAFYPRVVSPVHPRPFFLFAGTIEPRKNIPDLITAWQRARNETGADLILVGRVRSDAPSLPDCPGLLRKGELPDHELAQHYSQAIAAVYPSLYEGFGLPVLEAMQCACPVITSHDPAVTEVAGGAALHANGAEELAACMIRAAQETDLRERLKISGLERAKQYSWKNTAVRTQEIYSKALQR